MAKANWVKVNPSSGSGNGSVSVSSTAAHTGRNVRQSVLTWKAAGVSNVERTVKQAGKPEFVNMAGEANSDKDGKVVTISGVSNSQKLTFSLGTGDLNITLPSTYKAASLTTNNGANISGDPGASAEYDFSISITVPANDDDEPKTRQVIVQDAAGNRAICTLTLAAGDAYLSVQLGDIELDYKGTAVSVAVESNTSWTVE